MELKEQRSYGVKELRSYGGKGVKGVMELRS